MAKTYGSDEPTYYVPVGKRNEPPRGTDHLQRRIFILQSGNRVQLGTVEGQGIQAVIKAVYRDNGMAEDDFFLSAPITNSSAVLAELQKFCREHGEELSPTVYEAPFMDVCMKAFELVQGAWFS